MKVIFLDVDGVLNHSGCPEWNKGSWKVIDQECVERVKEVCRRTGARIVVSSSWRLDREGMDVLVGLFGDLIIGVIPYLRDRFNKEVPRHEEITSWILQHVTMSVDFVVIDDDVDAELEGLGRFIRTSATDGGFRKDQVETVVSILGEKK